jgi:hypothetical protein
VLVEIVGFDIIERQQHPPWPDRTEHVASCHRVGYMALPEAIEASRAMARWIGK